MEARVVGLGGSLRHGSTTTLALRIALAGAQEAGAQTQLIDLASLPLPFFNGSDDLTAYTAAEAAAVTTLLDSVRNSNGIIIASPTYHNTISGSVKNALDFLELLKNDKPPRLQGRVASVVAVQGGTSGTGINTLTTLLFAARALGAWVAPTMVSVPGSQDAFSASGIANNGEINDRLKALGSEVARSSRMFAGYWKIQ